MKIFIAGPRAIKQLNNTVTDRLLSITEKKHTVIVGDANGVDKEVQKYFHESNYPNVIVYASNGRARNNVGNWQVETVAVPDNVKGFDFFVAKDKAMADNADYGFMIWNGESKGTLNNMINLLSDEKKVLLFFTPLGDFTQLNSIEELNKLIEHCQSETAKNYKSLIAKRHNGDSQVSLFD
ncbi:MAG: hypothetical protein ACRCUS_03360 [Anaerovoracaceae bacterium]